MCTLWCSNATVCGIHPEDDVLRAWYLLYILWPLYIFLVVITFAFFHFDFILQALLSALCLNLRFRQDVQLMIFNENELMIKIRMVKNQLVSVFILASLFIMFGFVRASKPLLSSRKQDAFMTYLWNINMRQFIQKIKILKEVQMIWSGLHWTLKTVITACVVIRSVLYCHIA